MFVGGLVREARVRQGLSQRQLALRAGATQATISRIESGEQMPALETMERLLLVMGEQLELSARVPAAPYKREQLAANLSRSPSERLEHALDWMQFARDLRGAGRVAGE